MGRQNPDGSWEIKKAAAAPKGAESISMAYSGSDDPAIGYYDAATHDLRLAVLTDASGDFKATTVATNQGQYASVAPTGQEPLLFSYDAAVNDVQFFFNPSTAPGNDATIATDGGQYLNVAEGDGVSSNGPWVVYLDSVSGNLEVRPVPAM